MEVCFGSVENSDFIKISNKGKNKNSIKIFISSYNI